MNKIFNITNMSSKLAKEHKIVIEYISKFNNKLNQKDKNFFMELDTFLNFLEKDLHQHFELEEIIFFPSAILCIQKHDITRMVYDLQKDHDDIRKQLQRLLTEYKDLKQTKKSRQKLLKKIIGFFDLLKNHCKREMAEFYPMLDESTHCRELLIQHAEEMQQIGVK